MLIVPVLDLKDGRAVHARRGDRSRYQPLTSRFADSAVPADIVAGMSTALALSEVYIADLDALEKSTADIATIGEIAARHPGVRFLLDAGLRSADDVMPYLGHSNIDLVIASEALERMADFHALCAAIPAERRLLSLDRRRGQKLGCDELFDTVELWPSRVIHMNLDRVGAEAGPDLRGIGELRRLAPAARIYAAGGVRNARDIASLRATGATAVLVGTALHAGTLVEELQPGGG